VLILNTVLFAIGIKQLMLGRFYGVVKINTAGKKLFLI